MAMALLDERNAVLVDTDLVDRALLRVNVLARIRVQAVQGRRLALACLEVGPSSSYKVQCTRAYGGVIVNGRCSHTTSRLETNSSVCVCVRVPRRIVPPR